MIDSLPAAPYLLLATPVLNGGEFHQSVILMVDHGNHGSSGFVLNKPLGSTLGDVLDFGEIVERVPLFRGGPVQSESLQFLTSDMNAGGEVLPGLAALENLEDLESALKGIGEKHSIAGMLGYAGWGAGQLLGEMEEASWVIAKAEARHVFEIAPERLWATVLWEMGGRNRWMALAGVDPLWN